MADWTWSSPNPQGRDLFSHYKIQPFITIFYASVQSKNSHLLMGKYFLWYHSRNYVDHICFSLPLGCSEPSVTKTHMTTSPEYYTLWLTSLIDHGFWNRALLFFTTLYHLLCPHCRLHFPPPVPFLPLGASTRPGWILGFLHLTAWAVRLNRAITRISNYS